MFFFEAGAWSSLRIRGATVAEVIKTFDNQHVSEILGEFDYLRF